MEISGVELFDNGITSLVPITPPGASIAPSSSLAVSALGKTPGKVNAAGLWVGLDWSKLTATRADVESWTRTGAGTGIRMDRTAAVDIDVLDESLAGHIATIVRGCLGSAPERVGRPPKKLLLYRVDAPFSRMRMWVSKGTERHLVEVLARGNQAVASGVHPGTLKPYSWDKAPSFDSLTVITAAQVSAMFDALESKLGMLDDYEFEREGSGNIATAPVQSDLLAPSIDALREAVAKIKNDLDDRTSWVRMGAAIKAAAGLDEHAGLEIWSEWCERWDGVNPPETVLATWRSLRAPYTVGWPMIASMAGVVAEFAFPVIDPTPPAPEDVVPQPTKYSGQHLADLVLDAKHGELRYVPDAGSWFVWTGSRWRPDAVNLAESKINLELRRIGNDVLHDDSLTPAHRARIADAVNSGGKASEVRGFLQTCQKIVVERDAFDAQPMLLCTPGGIVDLETGTLRPAQPDDMASKSTSVAPDFEMPTPLWDAFINETFCVDRDLIRHVQRWMGYVLTGDVREQSFAFLLGSGANGKGVLTRVVSRIMGDYAMKAAFDTFTVTRGDKNSADLASMYGARLVTSDEAESTKAFDTQVIKSLTGEDEIKARLLYSNYFSYTPTYKVWIVGNSLPTLHSVDRAMKRRLQVIPFENSPEVLDNMLGKKLEAEFPGILAWMIRGCTDWLLHGLPQPEAVKVHTADYFDDMDSFSRFLDDETESGGFATMGALHERFRSWAHRGGEYCGDAKWLGRNLTRKKIAKLRTRDSRGYVITLKADKLLQEGR